MKWQGRRQSSNVEDRRRAGPPKAVVGGGCGTLLIVLVIILLGGNPMQLLDQGGGGGGVVVAPGQDTELSPREQELGDMAAVVLADTEDVWNQLFAQRGMQYREPTLVLFTGQVRSACGFTSAAVGPFYCPGDEKLYIDLSFFAEMETKLDAPGDFAQAYVIAHEVGHHVQNLLGASHEVNKMRGRVPQAQFNDLSVRLELQADYYAGVWAHHAQRMKQFLEPGDIEEGLRAANAIGDDTLQQKSQGFVVPDSFTHGTSEQRVYWFRKGLETGDMTGGDTFSVQDL